MTSPDGLLWLDLETTGLNHLTDSILEIAVKLTSPDLLHVHLTGHWPVMPHRPPAELLNDPAVLDMHTGNGLLDEVMAEGRPLWWVEAGVIDMCREAWGERAKGNVWLAGSGVAQFDLHWIRHQMPELAKWLNYRTIDVGQIRRLLELVGVAFEQPPTDHRAMTDVENSLQLAIRIGETIGNLGLRKIVCA